MCEDGVNHVSVCRAHRSASRIQQFCFDCHRKSLLKGPDACLKPALVHVDFTPSAVQTAHRGVSNVSLTPTFAGGFDGCSHNVPGNFAGCVWK